MEWTRGEVLGRGSSSTVNAAVFRRKLTGEPSPSIMAVKSCPISLSSTLMREKQILQLLSGCPEIVACYGDSISNDPEGQRYNIFLEYVAGGDLRNLCRRQRLATVDLRKYAASILRGLKAVHEAGIVHCDVKPENILVNGSSTKIADFGLATVNAEVNGQINGEVNGGGIRGTPMYIAPEVVQRGEYSAACDVWGFGCVLAEMATGRPARRWREGEAAAAMLFRVGCGEAAPEIPSEMGEEGRDFLKRCFEEDPRERWTAEMLLEHGFLRGEGGGEMEDSPRSVMEFHGRFGAAPGKERLRRMVEEMKDEMLDDSGEGWITVRSAGGCL